MSHGAELALSRDVVDGVTLLRANGEVDLTNADELQQAIEDTEASSVVLDLSELGYLDSSGIRAIERAHRRFVTEDRKLVVVTPDDTAAGWTFKVAGFDARLVQRSLDAAMALVVDKPE